MNALPQSDAHSSPPLPNGHFPPERSPLAHRGGYEGAIPFVPPKSWHDDRAPGHPFANQRTGERNRGKSERDSSNINGAHGAIESTQTRETETEQESSLNNSADDDGVPFAAGERHERRDGITQSLCQHFKGCLAQWTWEHYLCGATCAVMTFLLVLEWF